MGLFNSGKNDKVEKVNKSEGHNLVPPSKSHRRPSKHHQNHVDIIVRPTPQLSLMGANGNYFPGYSGFPQTYMGNYPQFKYGYPSNSPYDLTKYGQFNPFGVGQTTPTSFPPVWFNGMSPFNDRTPFQQQQPFNMYQQNGWSYYPPANNGYMQPFNF